MIILNQDGNIGGVFSNLNAGPTALSKQDNIMIANINSMDMAILTVFKRELQSIEALNRGCHLAMLVHPAVIEYLSLRISEIEEPLPKVMHTFTENKRTATVHRIGSTYYVRMYESETLIEERSMAEHSEQYAEDCAENWVVGII